jgi:hypothetical protein
MARWRLRVKFSKEELAAVATKLRDLPGKQDAKKHSKRAAITLLSREIAELKRRGYTIEQIAEALSGSGLPISTPTLKNYLHRGRRLAGKQSGSTPVNPRRAPGKLTVSTSSSFEAGPDSDDI